MFILLLMLSPPVMQVHKWQEDFVVASSIWGAGGDKTISKYIKFLDEFYVFSKLPYLFSRCCAFVVSVQQ
jgi:hypothetical protein